MPQNIDPISLSNMAAGENARFLGFQGGRNIKNRLVSLGFTPGVPVKMTQNYGRGPLIVIVRGTRVALGRGEASRIMVEQAGNE